MSSDQVMIRIHFVSGENLEVAYTKEECDALRNTLRGGWDINLGTENFVVNFAHVTYFEIIEDDNGQKD